MISSFWSDILNEPIADPENSSKPSSANVPALDRAQTCQPIGTAQHHINPDRTYTTQFSQHAAGASCSIKSTPATITDPVARQVLEALTKCAKECRLDRFYNAAQLSNLATLMAPMIPAIDNLVRNIWHVPSHLLGENLAYELVKLALFDVCIMCDDSDAVLIDDNKADLVTCLSYMVGLIRVLGQGKLKFRLVNSAFESDTLQTADDVAEAVRRISFRGTNNIANALRVRVCQKLVRSPLQNKTLTKPVLAVVIVIGRPIEGPESVLKITTENPTDVIRFAFAQIGNNPDVLQTLRLISKQSRHCDCTENYDSVNASLQRAGSEDMAPELWIMKVLLGAIDSSYRGLAEDDA